MGLEISQEIQDRLLDEAQKEGVSVDSLLKRLMDDHNAAASQLPDSLTRSIPTKPLAARLREIWADMPDSVRARLPADGAAQHDHYIYGVPKKNP